MTEAIVAGAIAGAVAGAIAGLAVMMASHGIPRRRGGDRVYTMRHTYSPQAPAPAQNAAQFARAATAGAGPFDRFNDRAKRVLALAQDEAIRFNHNYIGTEHILLGLVREGEGVAWQVLRDLGGDLALLRRQVEMIIGRGETTASPSEITMSPRTKKVIELAIDEARKLGHSHVGTEHLLLGIIREHGSIATGVLESAGLKPEAIRERVMAMLGQERGSSSPPRPSGGGPFSRFDSNAKHVLALSQDEANRFNHNYIGTEHLLLGLLRKEDSIAARVLVANGVVLDKARTAVGMIVPRGDATTSPSETTLSPRTKKVIEIAVVEADKLQQVDIGPAHLLLGLVREGEGIACGVIESLGVPLEKIRQDVLRSLSESH